jgi:aryl-alcohol dehydrogenase-like predicted oxidoreductase
MKSVRLGRTGLKVSQLCFGTMSFGGDADGAESKRLYVACRDAGIDFFDCADVYNGGKAEEILGDLIRPERDRIILTSKCASVLGDGSQPNRGGANRRHILKAVEDSLKRLGTDRLDILFLHRWDPETPIEESLRTLEDLVRTGKVVHIGASNYTAWQMAKSLGIQDRNAWSRFDVIQPMYNLLKRQAEVEILPQAAAEGLGVISYGPNAGGLLTGKYRDGARPEGARMIASAMYAKRYADDYYYDTAAQFTAFADRMGIHPVSLAVAWAAHHPAITCPIIGARSVEQLQASLASVDVPMSDALWADIAALTRRPPSPVDRDEEL